MSAATIAAQVGATNWIEEGAQVRGWYTCILTGKKMRGTEAEEQLALQARLVAEHEAGKAADEAHEGQADAAMITHKTDILNLTEEQDEHLLETGFAGISKRQYDLYTYNRDNMSGSLWDHMHSVEPTKNGKDPIKMTVIKCCDCDGERKIKVQDAFQVTRCVPCQIKHRNAIRAEKRKAKRAAAKAATTQE